MNVFDFDNTLYRGESAVDFALFMIKHNHKIILWLPTIFWNLLKYKLCLVSRKKMEQTINDFLQIILQDETELRKLAAQFWQKNERKLNTQLIRKITADDAIISAGPDFLLQTIQKRLGTSHLICSEVDYQTKRILHLNFGENKVRRYHEIYGHQPIDSFYTDSYNDKAMMDISHCVYLVKKGKATRITE